MFFFTHTHTGNVNTFTSLNIPIVGLNNLIKIDVQGYELQVLEGISKQIYKKIKWIYIELTDVNLYQGQSSREVIEKFLEENGFFLYKRFNIYPNKNDNNILYCDGLYKNKNID